MSTAAFHFFLHIAFISWLYSLFFCKQKTAYEIRISDWSSDVCSSDLLIPHGSGGVGDELVGEALARLDAELGHVGHAVHFPGPALQNSMPVDRVVERRQIVQENLNLVAFPHMEKWGRNLPAESESLEGLIADQRNARLFDIHHQLKRKCVW